MNTKLKSKGKIGRQKEVVFRRPSAGSIANPLDALDHLLP